MRTWKLFPQNKIVAKYVDCYWLLEKEPGDVGYTHPKLNPDPAAHLILAKPEQEYRYSQNTQSARGRGCHWIFAHRKSFEMDHSEPFLILGIKFHVGVLYSLKLSSMTPAPALDQVVVADPHEIMGLEDVALRTLLAKTVMHSQNSCIELDELLLPWLLDGRSDKHSELTNKALPQLCSTSVSDMGAALCCSQRTLERSFLRVTQLTLKQYQSMMRLEAIMDYIYQMEDTSINWADVAAQFEFSDQPHLIRHLKDNIGSTPAAYVRRRDFAIDVYGNFE